MRAKTNGGKVSRRSINQCPLRGTLRRAQRTFNVGSVEKPQTERHSRHRDHKRVLDCLKQCVPRRDIPRVRAAAIPDGPDSPAILSKLSRLRYILTMFRNFSD